MISLKHRNALIAATLGGVVILTSAASCGNNKFTEPFNDAHRSGVDNSQPMDVVENADGFSNVGTKCDHGNRIYVAYHGDHAYASIAAVGNDPSCAGSK